MNKVPYGLSVKYNLWSKNRIARNRYQRLLSFSSSILSCSFVLQQTVWYCWYNDLKELDIESKYLWNTVPSSKLKKRCTSLKCRDGQLTKEIIGRVWERVWGYRREGKRKKGKGRRKGLRRSSWFHITCCMDPKGMLEVKLPSYLPGTLRVVHGKVIGTLKQI